MSWAGELRDALRRLGQGAPGRVDFTGRGELVEELGREFNDFTGEMGRLPAGPLSRDQRHALRNRLAGILAAVHVLRESGGLAEGEEEAVRQSLIEAEKIDLRLRGE